MALTAEQVKALSEFADHWLTADADERDQLQRAALEHGDAFSRAFLAMVSQLSAESSATLLPPISEAAREAAIVASFSCAQHGRTPAGASPAAN
jgi:hypothetical protein